MRDIREGFSDMQNLPQLVLNLRLKEESSFENFLGESNRQALGVFREALSKKHGFILLHGGVSTGKSHLLHAACHQWQEQGKSIVNVPLAEHGILQTSVLEGLEQYALIGLDDIDLIFGKPDWELALFNLYNRAQMMGATMVGAVSCSPQRMACGLPDLLSRLRSGVSISLVELTEAERVQVFVDRASQRGLVISDDLVKYIMSRSERRLDHLLDTLQKVDDLSLKAKRKLTIPFVKAALGW